MAPSARSTRGEVLRGPEGQPLAISAIAQDLTEHKAIETELRNSREQLRRLSSHLQAAREEERARMSREIYDELGGMLTGLKMDVARLGKTADRLSPAELRERAQTFPSYRQHGADGAPHRQRPTARHPGRFWSGGGHRVATEGVFARAGLECDYETNVDELDLEPAASTALFRLFQETLTNVARHAQATRVTARLEIEGDELVINVRDNGRGISTGEIGNSKSLGLLGMRERVQQLNGDLDIRGEPGRGTTVTVLLPLDSPDGQRAAGMSSPSPPPRRPGWIEAAADPAAGAGPAAGDRAAGVERAAGPHAGATGG